ncbi:MAG TPA: phage portal protein [Candidatus Dormibacteraeota bacterium]|nr:phage portal protein [Candidatus Dormibacteraeota bacterium]
MKITEAVRGALRRVAGVSAAGPTTAIEKKRRTSGLPSIFNSYGPMTEAMPKPTPYNLRRFSETPIARRAINCIKDRIAGMRWRVQPRQGLALESTPDGAARAGILAANFAEPNPDDSFRSLAEQVLEDIIVGGFGAIEVQESGDPARPLAMWAVDGASIRMNLEWDGSPQSQRYVQVGDQSNSQIKLNDDELIYIRLNPRTHTPFGLGRLEVAFETINAFLAAHRYASRLASNSVVQYALWLQDLTPEHHERLIRWWQDEIEGTGKVPILSVESKPEVLRFGGGTDADLRLQWQEFLLRVVASAFDLPPFYLGVERDVNRSTAEEMNELAFRQAIVPTARLLAESLTRGAIGKRLGWSDLEFVFADVDATDPLEEAQIQEILLRNGVLTVNEVRRMRGLAELEG